MDAHQLLLFMAAGLLLNLTPGPDVLCIVSSALRGGARSGIVAALGITAGCLVHVLAAAVGVSALLAASTTAFTVLKWLGAAYLVWAGVRLLLSATPSAIKLIAIDAGLVRAEGLKSVFFRGFATNALNPKVALFFLAFLPQFIAPGVDQKALAFLALGLVFSFNSLWVNIGWALAAAWLAGRLAVVQQGLAWLDRVAGVMFLGFGLRLALSENPNS